MTPDTNPICPKCRQGDQVQKVTHLYDANTEQWTEEQSGMDRFGHIEDRHVEHEAHTKLGLKLKPPEEPESPPRPGLWYGVGILVAVMVLASACPFVVIPLAIAIPIVLSGAPTLPAALRGSNGTSFAIVVVATLVIIALIVLAVLVWLGVVVKRRYDRDMVRYREKKEAHEDAMQHYQRAKERWERLYYCARDDIVFIPAENSAVPVEEMGKYIRDPYYKLS